MGEPTIEGLVEARAREVHAGLCPFCSRRSPTEAHHIPKFRQLFFNVGLGPNVVVCCTPCARGKRMEAMALTIFVGWFRVPFGPIWTVADIARNMSALSSPPDPTRPSRQLIEHVRPKVVAEWRAANLPHCPNCDVPYDVGDYRADAPVIRCGSCNAELPRTPSA